MPDIAIATIIGNEAGMVSRTMPSWLGWCDELCLLSTQGNSEDVLDEVSDLLSVTLAWPRLGVAGAPCVRDAPCGVRVRAAYTPWARDFGRHLSEAAGMAQSPWVLIMACDEKLIGIPAALREHLEALDLVRGHVEAMTGAPPESAQVFAPHLAEIGRDAKPFSRCFRWQVDGWRWRYHVDPAPYPAEGEEIAMSSLPPDVMTILHLRPATRRSSCVRKLEMVEWVLANEEVDDDERAHLEKVRELATRWMAEGEGEGGEGDR